MHYVQMALFAIRFYILARNFDWQRLTNVNVLLTSDSASAYFIESQERLLSIYADDDGDGYNGDTATTFGYLNRNLGKQEKKIRQ